MTRYQASNDYNVNKKAELSQRWPRDAPYMWVRRKFPRIPEYAHGYFPEIYNGLMSWSFLLMCVHKMWAVPEYARASFSPKFLMGFCLDFGCTLWMFRAR